MRHRENNQHAHAERGHDLYETPPEATRALIEAAWSYQYPARVSRDMEARVAAAPLPARAIAWKAQVRLSSRYRALIRRGKLKTVAVTAVAREMAGFIWDICRTLAPNGVRP